MYLEHFGLQEAPFRSEYDRRYLYFGPIHRRALRYLNDAVDYRDRATILVGLAGLGKTILIRYLIAELAERARIGYLDGLSPEGQDLPTGLAHAFGVHIPTTAKEPLHDLLQTLRHEQRIDGRPVLLFIDKTDELSLAGLSTLYRLTAIGVNKGLLLGLFLIGRLSLLNTLALPEFEALRRRTSLSLRLDPLDPSQTRAYIRHRLDIARASNLDLFDVQATHTIHKYTGGIALSIDQLCTQALMVAARHRLLTIQADQVRDAAKEIGMPPFREAPVRLNLKHSGDALQAPARLVIHQSHLPDQDFPLGERTVTIGRREYNEIAIRDHLISREHARISRRDGRYYIEDLLSTNGTYINGTKINGHYKLQAGDIIRLGEAEVAFYDQGGH